MSEWDGAAEARTQIRCATCEDRCKLIGIPETKGCTRWTISNAVLLAAARTRIAELEAERDAAHKKGWEDAKQAAVEAITDRIEDLDSEYNAGLHNAIQAIRAVEPEEKP